MICKKKSLFVVSRAKIQYGLFAKYREAIADDSVSGCLEFDLFPALGKRHELPPVLLHGGAAEEGPLRPRGHRSRSNNVQVHLLEAGKDAQLAALAGGQLGQEAHDEGVVTELRRDDTEIDGQQVQDCLGCLTVVVMAAGILFKKC